MAIISNIIPKFLFVDFYLHYEYQMSIRSSSIDLSFVSSMPDVN